MSDDCMKMHITPTVSRTTLRERVIEAITTTTTTTPEDVASLADEIMASLGLCEQRLNSAAFGFREQRMTVGRDGEPKTWVTRWVTDWAPQ